MNTQKCTGRKLFYVTYRVDRYDCWFASLRTTFNLSSSGRKIVSSLSLLVDYRMDVASLLLSYSFFRETLKIVL